MKKREGSRSSRVSKSSVDQLRMWDGRQHLRPSTPPTIGTAPIITTPTILSTSTLSTAASQQSRSSSGSTSTTSHASTSTISSGTAHEEPPLLTTAVTAAAAQYHRHPSPITATGPFSAASTGTAVHQRHHPSFSSSTAGKVHSSTRQPSSTVGHKTHSSIRQPFSSSSSTSGKAHSSTHQSSSKAYHQYHHPSTTATHTSTHHHHHPPSSHTNTHQYRHPSGKARTSTPSTDAPPPLSIPSTSTGETAFQQCSDLILLQNALLENSIKHRNEVMNQSLLEKESYEDVRRSLENEKVEHATTKCLLSAEQEKTQLALTEVQVLTKQLDREKATFEKAFGLLRSQALSDTTKAESLVAKCSALESLVGGKDEEIAKLKGQVHELMERIKDMRQSHKIALQEAHVRMEQEKYLAQHFGGSEENDNNRGRSKTKPRGQR